MKYVGVEVEGVKEGKNDQEYEVTMIFDFATNLELNVGDEVVVPYINSRNTMYDSFGTIVEVNKDKMDYKYKEIKEYFIPRYLEDYENYVKIYSRWLDGFNKGTTQYSWEEFAKPKKPYLIEKYNEFEEMLQEQIKAEREEELLKEKEKQFEEANKKKGFFQWLLNKITA